MHDRMIIISEMIIATSRSVMAVCAIAPLRDCFQP